MPGRRLWLLAAALLLPGPGRGEPGPAPLPGLEGESFGSEDGGKVIVARKARFSTKDAELSADEIRMNTADATIDARGHVIYTSENLRIFGERARVDSRTGRIVAENVRFGRAPAYFAADRFTMEKGNQAMEGVTVWYHEPAASGMSLRANEVIYNKADDRLVLKHIHPAVGDLPFFYVARYTQRGYRAIPAEVYLRFGTSSPKGAYIRTTTTIRQSEALWAGLLLDAYGSAGWLAGPTVRYDNWKLPGADMRWMTSLEAGWINDHSDLAAYPDAYGRTPGAERYFVNASLIGRSGDGWELAGSLQAMSDPLVTRDFRPRQAAETQLPRTFLELCAPVGGGYATALVSVRTDDFQDVSQRLPELRLDLPERPLGWSDWLGRLSLAASHVTERDSEMLNGAGFLAATGMADRVGFTRLDAYAGVSHPTTFGDWLTVKPVAGVRSIWWSDTTAGSGTAARSIAQVGLDAEMLAIGTWDTRSERWGIDGLRHTVRPFAQWRATPATGSDLGLIQRADRLNLATVNAPVVDLADRPDTDTITERQVAQFGIRNTLETRDPRLGTRELLRADIFSDWREDLATTAGGSSGIYAHLAWNPKSWLAVESLLKFDNSLSDHLGSATWVRINSGDLWKATAGLSDLSEGIPARQAFATYSIRLNSAYRVSLSGTYDLMSGSFIERHLMLGQKIGNSWDLEYGLSQRVSSQGDGSLGFSVRARLFRF